MFKKLINFKFKTISQTIKFSYSLITNMDKKFPLNSVEETLELLKDQKLKFEVQYHDPIDTIEASKNILKKPLDSDFQKNIFPVNKFIKDKKDKDPDGGLYLLVQDPSQKVEFKQIAQILKIKDNLRLGDKDLLYEKLGVTQGSVNPFALINNLKVKFLLDKTIYETDTICIHPMKNVSSLYMKTADLLKLLKSRGVEPIIMDFGPGNSTACHKEEKQNKKQEKPEKHDKPEPEKHDKPEKPEKEEINLENNNIVMNFSDVEKLLVKVDAKYEIQSHGKVIEKDLPNIIHPPKASEFTNFVLGSNKFMRDKKSNSFYLLLHDAKHKVEYKHISYLLGLKENPKLGDKEILKEKMNIVDGGVNPFALLNSPSVKFLLDKVILDTGVVCVHPMDVCSSVFIKVSDLLKLLKLYGIEPVIMDFTTKVEHKEEVEEKNTPDKKGVEYPKEDKCFAKWYQQVITKSEMIDYYEISGCYILRPWAYQMWEFITAYFDKKIKEDGVENAYFPLFVSKHALEKEKEHVEGFSPEVAWVTKSGSKDLENPIAIRPTSETIMYPSYANWIRSHRDLPLKLNQWTNIVRWEFKNPTPFIRTREFLWQEGHTAHATFEEADKEVHLILDFYKQVYEELLAVPVIQGIKSENEKFAGGFKTTTIETMVPTIGKGIQCATSHHLGQNFSKMFGIKFESENMTNEYVWQTSWGLTTRTIGVAVMVHGDNKGLVLPPRIAPIQVILIPIIKTEDEKDGNKSKILNQIFDIFKSLKQAGIRCKVDDRDNYGAGWKYNYWEMKGVPIRLEFGINELKQLKVQLCCRDNKEKLDFAIQGLEKNVEDLLVKIQARMLENAKVELNAIIKLANSNEELFKLITEKKMIKTMWCNTSQCEDNVKKMVKETLVKINEANKLEKKKQEKSGNEEEEEVDITEITAKTLCMPLEQDTIPTNQKCFSCNLPAKKWVLWGKTY